jgi:hypothetical protein
VKVLVQPPKDSLEAIATEFFSSRSVRVLVGMGHGHYLLSAEAATLSSLETEATTPPPPQGGNLGSTPGATTRPPTGRSRERGPSVHLSSLHLSSRPMGVRIGPRHRNTSPDGPCGHRPRAHARWPVTLPQEVPLAVIAGQERGARDIGLLNGK